MRKGLFFIAFSLVFCLSAFAQETSVDCPIISVTGPSSAMMPREPMIFRANVSKEAEKYSVKYVWSVSAGKIISGQGSNVLTVNKETNGSVTATVKIQGLPENCPNSASETGTFLPEHEPVASDELENFGAGGTKGRIDNFLIELQNDKNSEGIVIFQNNDKVLKRLKYLREYIRFRNFSPVRLTIIIRDKNDDLTEFWRVPGFNDLHDWKDAFAIKFEDFEALQKLFTPKTVKTKTKK